MAGPPDAGRERVRQLQAGLAALLVLSVVVGIVLAATGGSRHGGGPAPPASARAVALPAPRERGLARAAREAGCLLLDPRDEGRGHTTGTVAYASNPPTSGPHDPVPALDGVYRGRPPRPEQAVHALEHGRIEVQYRPGTPRRRVAELESVVAERFDGRRGYKTLLFENPTHMPYAVAATAWGHLLGCDGYRPALFDALRDFRARFVDRGPETGFPPNA
jgi:hypothetical protein